MNATHFNVLVIVVCVATLAGGCGPERPATIPVTGRVTFQNGDPPRSGSVAFAPIEPADGFPRRPAYASFDENGELTVSSFTAGDGLVPGRYQARVICWKTPPSDDAPGESYVPEGYRPAEIAVASGAGEVEINIDVPAK